MLFARLRKKTRIADLVPGDIATVKGVVQSRHRLAIPPSGTTCVYYALMEERFGQGSRGRGRPLWFPDRFESKCAEFTVSDDTGAVTVRESGERIRGQGLHREEGPVKGSSKRRFFAEFLRPGDTVIVRGRVDKSSDGSTLVLLAPPSRAVKIAVVRRAV